MKEELLSDYCKIMILSPKPIKGFDKSLPQQVITSSKEKRSRLVVPELNYQTISIEGDDFQNKIDNAFNLLFEAMAKTDVHKYN